jgi:hypothetical protein
MSPSAPLDQRARRELREQAIWRTKIAGYAAFVSASLGVVIFSMIGLDTGEWASVGPSLLGAGLTFGFGAGVYFGRSQVAAAVLMILAAATMILRIVQTGAIGGIMISGVAIYCYVQGFRGAVDLAELAQSEEPTPVERAI